MRKERRLDLIMISIVVLIVLIFACPSADAQGYVVTEGAVPAAGGGKRYFILPIEPRKTYTAPSTGYVPRATTTSNPLTSVATPHWQIWSGNGYWGYFHTEAHCAQTMALLRKPLIGYTLICRYVR